VIAHADPYSAVLAYHTEITKEPIQLLPIRVKGAESITGELNATVALKTVVTLEKSPDRQSEVCKKI
jgi:hypothetical protein